MSLDRMSMYNTAMYNWNGPSQAEKLREVFGCNVNVSSPNPSQINSLFTIELTCADEGWVPAKISSDDLVLKMGLSTTEWSIWISS